MSIKVTPCSPIQRSWLVGLLVTALLILCGSVTAQEAPVVAAAADLQFALVEIAKSFHQETSQDIRLSFGSSGNFAAQIENGAPFQLFLSADEEYVSRLKAHGFTLDDGVLYTIGRIVLFIPNGSTLKADASLRDLRDSLADGRLKKFAIANPEHAPYGRAARAVLQHQGLWEAIQPFLVLGENAAQAAQFATSGSAQGGMIPLSLAQAPALTQLGHFAPLPADWHPSLRQRMVLLRSATEPAKAFYAYLQTPAARAVFSRYGFIPPDER